MIFDKLFLFGNLLSLDLVYFLRVFGMKYRLLIMQLATLLLVTSFIEQFTAGLCVWRMPFLLPEDFNVLFRYPLEKGAVALFNWFIALKLLSILFC